MTAPNPSTPRETPPAQARHPLLWGWAILAIVAVAWDISGLDMQIMVQLGSPQGFAWRNNWWLSTVLHDRLRLVAQMLFLAMLVWAGWPQRAGSLPRRERWLVVGLVMASLLAVNLIKINSRTSCPWDLQVFGGEARYVSHWLLGVSDGGTGRCFPGGHASSAFAFFALCLPWLSVPVGVQRARAPGWRWLALVVTVGLVAGFAQTLRGAHHPSHTLWTLVICAGISIAGWSLAQRWLRGKPQAAALAGKP